MSLPEPQVANWQRLYEPNAKARCIKDNPPMRGFGKTLKVGDEVEVGNVCYSSCYELAVPKECAFYTLEGYFEVIL